jgi:hypothetical protein
VVFLSLSQRHMRIEGLKGSGRGTQGTKMQQKTLQIVIVIVSVSAAAFCRIESLRTHGKLLRPLGVQIGCSDGLQRSLEGLLRPQRMRLLVVFESEEWCRLRYR